MDKRKKYSIPHPFTRERGNHILRELPITQEEKDAVKEFFKKIGYNDYEPIHLQFARKYNLNK